MAGNKIRIKPKTQLVCVSDESDRYRSKRNDNMRVTAVAISTRITHNRAAHTDFTDVMLLLYRHI